MLKARKYQHFATARVGQRRQVLRPMPVVNAQPTFVLGRQPRRPPDEREIMDAYSQAVVRAVETVELGHDGLSAFVAYHQRLADGTHAAGLAVTRPGQLPPA